MQKKISRILGASLLLISGLPCIANAGVQIGGTRLIYDGHNKQATIGVNNPDDRPYLIQSWVNQKIDADDNDDAFITTPPLFRLEPHSQNSVRVVYNGQSLPQDKESVFWLNIKAIPSSEQDAKNKLLIAVKNRIKLFYRPEGITGQPATAYRQLQFRQHDGKLSVCNPTPFSVSLYDIKVNNQSVNNPPMVMPQSELSLGNTVATGSQIRWRAINDFGGITEEQKVKI